MDYSLLRLEEVACLVRRLLQQLHTRISIVAFGSSFMTIFQRSSTVEGAANVLPDQHGPRLRAEHIEASNGERASVPYQAQLISGQSKNCL